MKISLNKKEIEYLILICLSEGTKYKDFRNINGNRGLRKLGEKRQQFIENIMKKLRKEAKWLENQAKVIDLSEKRKNRRKRNDLL